MLSKRSMAGLLLMALAIFGMVYWELHGREAVLTDPVFVAKKDIPAGTKAGSDDFMIMRVPEENRVKGAMSFEGQSVLTGRITNRFIHKNQQILPDYFFEEDFLLREGESIFVIKPEWISMRSSSIRRGDLVDIYEDQSFRKLGSYRVAFVKDQDETEVTDPETLVQNPLDRIAGTSAISHIEIITRLPDYLAILKETAEAAGAAGAGLILVQKRSGAF